MIFDDSSSKAGFNWLLSYVYRVSNSLGNLLEIYKVSWKFSGLVCEFARLLLILVTILVFQSVSVQNISQ